MLVIKGIQKTTLVDYPGKIAATVFTAGCNFRCGFCHNSLLVREASELPSIPVEEVLAYLRGRTHQLEGICISGGEPTLHPGLPEFIRELKGMGYAVKLDTNGSNPEMLALLLRDKMLDYIAMDIKGPIEIYPAIVNAAVNKEKILQSIEMIKTGNVDHEFRTTALPEFHLAENVENIGCLLRGAKNYCLQQFQSCEGLLDPQFQHTSVYPDKDLHELARRFEPFVGKVKVRGVA